MISSRAFFCLKHRTSADVLRVGQFTSLPNFWACAPGFFTNAVGNATFPDCEMARLKSPEINQKNCLQYCNTVIN